MKYPSEGRRVIMIFLKEKMMIFLLFVLRLQGDCYSNLFFLASGLVTCVGAPGKRLSASFTHRRHARQRDNPATELPASPIGFFNSIITTEIFTQSRNPVISMAILEIPHPVHTFNVPPCLLELVFTVSNCVIYTFL